LASKINLLLPSIILVLWLSSPAQKPDAPQGSAVFLSGAQKAGLTTFTLRSGTLEKKYIMETMSSGVCLFDYNNDSLVDIYLVNGGTLDSFRNRTRSSLENALFKNLGNRRFQDVTEEAGVGGNGAWGMGCSVADYDNDGHLDLYVANYGSNILYHNLGNGKLEDVTQNAQVDDVRWSTGSSWADFDKDGDLDLFVANYIELDRENLPEPGSAEYGTMGSAKMGCQYKGLPVSCGPGGMNASGDSLFVNQGDGTFRERSKAFGMDDPQGHYGLGALWGDLDGDGWTDLYVANDGGINFLYHNLGGGRFDEIGLLSGAGVRGDGAEQSSMGVAVGDYLHQERLSIFVTHFAEDYCTLYRNDGDLNFADVSEITGISAPTFPFVSWGAFFFDYDKDGWLDIFVADGHVFPQADQIQSQSVAPYRQRGLLFQNLSNGRFKEVGERAGLTPARISRGAAVADLDNDGCLDIVVNNLDESPSLFWNSLKSNANHYLTLKLVGTTSNRAAIGARVRLRTQSMWQMQEVVSGGSYLSQNDLRLHFGLGRAEKADEVLVRWPNGKTSALKDVPADQILTIAEK